MNMPYIDFISYRGRAFFLGTLLLTTVFKAQIIVNVTLPWHANDILSRDLYRDIVSKHRKLGQHTSAKTGVIARTKEVYTESNRELTRISPRLISEKDDILKFVYRTSYEYIRDTYPVLPSSPFVQGKASNILVRGRFLSIFNTEGENIGNYFENSNYMPEGERLRLIQQALEKVIRVTLEDETY